MELKKTNVILYPIGIYTQIESCLFGTNAKENTQLKEKILQVKNNLQGVLKINGSYVYDVIFCENFNNLYYNLQPTPERPKNLLLTTADNQVLFTREYYYPVQYAEIEIVNFQITNHATIQ